MSSPEPPTPDMTLTTTPRDPNAPQPTRTPVPPPPDLLAHIQIAPLPKLMGNIAKPDETMAVAYPVDRRIMEHHHFARPGEVHVDLTAVRSRFEPVHFLDPEVFGGLLHFHVGCDRQP